MIFKCALMTNTGGCDRIRTITAQWFKHPSDTRSVSDRSPPISQWEFFFFFFCGGVLLLFFIYFFFFFGGLFH